MLLVQPVVRKTQLSVYLLPDLQLVLRIKEFVGFFNKYFCSYLKNLKQGASYKYTADGLAW